MCLFFHPWKKWQKCPWKLRTARGKTPKVPVKNKRWPWTFSKCRIFDNFHRQSRKNAISAVETEKYYPLKYYKSVSKNNSKWAWKNYKKCTWNCFLPIKKIKKWGKMAFWFSRDTKKQTITVWVIITTIDFMLSPPPSHFWLKRN